MRQLRRFVMSFFPSPRRAVKWLDALPLVVFFILFIGICAGLEFGHVWMFARPLMLGLILIALMVLRPNGLLGERRVEIV